MGRSREERPAGVVGTWHKGPGTRCPIVRLPCVVCFVLFAAKSFLPMFMCEEQRFREVHSVSVVKEELGF